MKRFFFIVFLCFLFIECSEEQDASLIEIEQIEPPATTNDVVTDKDLAINVLRGSQFYSQIHSSYKNQLDFSRASYRFSRDEGVGELVIPIGIGNQNFSSVLSVAIPGGHHYWQLNSSCRNLFARYFTGAVISFNSASIPFPTSTSIGLPQRELVRTMYVYNPHNKQKIIEALYYKDKLTGAYHSSVVVNGSGEMPRWDLECPNFKWTNVRDCFTENVRRVHFGALVIATFIRPDWVVLGLLTQGFICGVRECVNDMADLNYCLNQLEQFYD